MAAPHEKLKLQGFNNLTKTLSFNIYDVCYAKTRQHRLEYIEYIDEAYNAERLTQILTHVSNIIGATILNIAHQDYEPQGASVTMLIAEGPMLDQQSFGTNGHEVPKSLPEAVVAHLDKSHITVHTYPESHPDNGISTFRADIDVSTCGQISPLNALNYLIHTFESDVVRADYRVRGFTRDVSGHKLFIDHEIGSIQDYLDADIRDLYRMTDVNIREENIFHTKMMLKDIALDNYLFGTNANELTLEDEQRVCACLEAEMRDIFEGRSAVARAGAEIN